MHLIARVLSVASLAALTLAAPASAQTTVTGEATVWHTPGVPADDAIRAVVRIDDPGAAAPAISQRITLYLPHGVALQGGHLPTCAADVAAASGPAGCRAGSQVGSGRIRSLVGPEELALVLDAFVINGAEPGQVLVYLQQTGGGVELLLEGRVGASDDPMFGSALTVDVPLALRHPVVGLDNPLTEVDLLLRTSTAQPFAAIAGCPLGALPFKAVAHAPGPIADDVSATCLSGPPPAVAPMPHAPEPPPPYVDPLVPPAAVERVAAPFGVKLRRVRGKVRRLRLTGVAANAQVSARCLRRCGRPGNELIASVRGATARLRRPLRARSRFELRVGGAELVTRFARYEVNRRRTRVRVVAAGCRDAAGKRRACPPAR